MAQDWDIRARGAACAGCSEVFANGQAYVSALLFGGEGYTRTDFCSTCWERKPETAADAFSTWRGTYRAQPQKPGEPVKRERAESLLRSLMASEDPVRLNAIYILAVMLERKRILQEKEVRREGGPLVRVYEHRGTGETFLVTDPGLRLDQLREVQQQVVDLLEGGLKAGTAPAAAPVEAAPAPTAPAPPPEAG
jgi:hypothetical protein